MNEKVTYPFQIIRSTIFLLSLLLHLPNFLHIFKNFKAQHSRPQFSGHHNPVSGLCTSLRTYTARRTPNQFFWCFDYQGTMFKFYPDEERTELVG
ncbi:MAG: hypothetical protein ACMUHX_03635, partial [bacterium]